jgi:hypothetical protein
MAEDKLKNALVGAAVGAGLSKIFDGNTMLLALAGAAIGASVEGRENAKKLNSPVVFVENGKLMKEFPDGRKEFIKSLKKTNRPDFGKKFTI